MIKLKEMNLPVALNDTALIWGELADNPLLEKAKVWLAQEYLHYNKCPLCAYVTKLSPTNKISRDACKINCPLRDLWDLAELYAWEAWSMPCEAQGGPYAMWKLGEITYGKEVMPYDRSFFALLIHEEALMLLNQWRRNRV